MKIKDILLEVGNSWMDYTTDESDPYVMSISAMDNRLQVYFSKTPRGEVFIEFWMDNQRNITGSGNAFKILSTVAKILENELAKFVTTDVKSVHFGADKNESSRIKLYRRAVPVLSSILGPGWEFNEETGPGNIHEFNWVRKSIREDQLELFPGKIYYVMINGRIWKKEGKPVEFKSYREADRAAISIIDRYGKPAQVVDPERYPVKNR